MKKYEKSQGVIFLAVIFNVMLSGLWSGLWCDSFARACQFWHSVVQVFCGPCDVFSLRSMQVRHYSAYQEGDAVHQRQQSLLFPMLKMHQPGVDFPVFEVLKCLVMK